MIGRGPAGVRGTPAGRWRRSVVVGLAVGGVACGSGEPPRDATTTSDIDGSESVAPDASPSPTGAVTKTPPSPMGTTSPTTPAEDEPDEPGETTTDTGAGPRGASPKPTASPSPSLSPPKDLPATPETDKPHAPG